MRVTLRTILAYLDDQLEPADARQIGEKISESKEASALVARIREAIRRRRIGSPELAGPGSGPDPNLVADYLENQLPAGQVVELERLCQASDVHLAEVAACHKILTMVMGQPIIVPEEMRERMYALGATRVVQEQTSSTGMPPMTEGIGTNTSGSLETGLPEYLTRRTWTQRYGAIAVVCVTALIWMVLILTDHALWDQSRVAITVPMATDEAPQDPEHAGAQQAEKPQEVPPGVAAKPEVDAIGPAATTTAPAVAKNEQPMPSAAPAVANATPEMRSPANSTETSPAEATALPPLPAPVKMPDVVAPVLPLEEPELSLTYQSGDELMIQKSPTEADWRLLPVEVAIELEDEVASPAPFRNTYGVPNRLDVTLEPGTRIQRLPRGKDADLGLALNRGKLVLYRPEAAMDPVVLRLRVLGRDWILTLLDPATHCAIELERAVPNGAMSALPPSGGITVIAGRVKITSEGQPELIWKPQEGVARWPASGTQLATAPNLATPSWASLEHEQTPAARQLARLFQKEFLPDRTIQQSIAPVTKNRTAAVATLAVKTMSLIDWYPALVPALGGEHQESRIAAIEGLRHWLLIDPDNESLLEAELLRSYRAESFEPIVRLLWGYNIDDARNPSTSQQLVEFLKSDQIAIRELAFYHITRLTGRTYDYLPMASASERRAAAQRWAEYLDRNGGTLLPQ